MSRSCAACGAPSADHDARFCSRCGGPVIVTSDATGTAEPPDLLVSGGSSVLAGDRDTAGAGPVGRRRRLRVAAVAGAAVLTVGAGGAAVWAATALSGGGTQPEDVLPADALGFAKVDLDPSAGQKIAAYRLAQKFPDNPVEGEDSLRDDLISELLDPEDEQVYDRDVKPWLGQRAGLAYLAPSPDDPEAPVAVAAVQVTDREEAERGLAALAQRDEATGEPIRWAFAEDDDYVLLSDDQEAVDDAVREQDHLADQQGFRDAVEALEGDTVALAWMDLGRIWDAVPEEQRTAVTQDDLQLDPEGEVVMGARVADGAVEVVGRSLGMSLGDDERVRALVDNAMGRAGSTGLVGELPRDSIGAVSITGLGDGMAQLYESYRDELESAPEVTSFLDEFGLRLPEDLRSVLGSELAMSFGGGPTPETARLDMRVRTEDAGRAVSLLTTARDRLAKDAPVAADVEVDEVEGGYRVSTAARRGSGRLADDEVFQRTVPDATTSGMTYYFDVQRVLGLTDGAGRAGMDETFTDRQRRNLEPVRGIGYTATREGESDVSFRIRLTVRE